MKKKVKIILSIFCFLFIICNPINVCAQNAPQQTPPIDELMYMDMDDEENAQIIEILLNRIKDLDICLIPKSKRMTYLFPDGTPTSSEEMSKYLTTIEVLVWTGYEDKTIGLTVHKKLAKTYERIFNELYLMQFPINQASCYCFRTMNNGTNTTKLSHHSYGVAIDINWAVNPHISSGSTPDESSQYYINEDVVKIFKAHGFYWGGDWDDPWTDWMHFTYTDH